MVIAWGLGLRHVLGRLADQSCKHKRLFNCPMVGERISSENVITIPSEVPVQQLPESAISRNDIIRW